MKIIRAKIILYASSPLEDDAPEETIERAKDLIFHETNTRIKEQGLKRESFTYEILNRQDL